MIEVKATVKELDGPLDLWSCTCPECGETLEKTLPDDLVGAHFECHCKVDCDSCAEFDTRSCVECKATNAVKIKANK